MAALEDRHGHVAVARRDLSEGIQHVDEARIQIANLIHTARPTNSHAA